jgi:hypothetical protein
MVVRRDDNDKRGSLRFTISPAFYSRSAGKSHIPNRKSAVFVEFKVKN